MQNKSIPEDLIEIIDDSLEEIGNPSYDAWDTSGDDDILMHVADLEKLNPRFSIQQDNWKKQHQHPNLPAMEFAKKPLKEEKNLHTNNESDRKLTAKVPKLERLDTIDDLAEHDNKMKTEQKHENNTYQDKERSRPSEDHPKLQLSHNRQITFLTQQVSMNEYTSNDSRESSVTPDSGRKRVRAITLSEEQEHVIELARRKMNIFYTGSAGTGKSVLLKELIKTLKSMYGNTGAVAVTASTGLAACNIGGITLHSFAGIGLGIGDEAMLLKKVRRSAKHRERWKSIKALVIDEISMIDGNLLDKLDGIAKTIRRSKKPFGGIQIILCGDFFQLPPVTKSNQ